MTLHFAYGSNMSRALMARRCRGAQAIGTATLPDWRFVINPEGFGSIAPQPGGCVHGVLWRLSARDLAAVNAYESVDPGLYVRRRLAVRCGETQAMALVYMPRPGYIPLVVEAAREWQLPEGYIRSLARWAPSRWRGVRAKDTGEVGQYGAQRDAGGTQAAPEPPARYSNLRVYEGKNFVRRDEVLDKPLIAGRQYSLEVSIGLRPVGVPVVGKVEMIRPLGTPEPADLFVVVVPADEAEWEIYDPIQPLRLPPAGPTEEPATFTLTPKSGPARRRHLLVKIYYRLNLIDSLVFAPFVVPVEGEDSKPQDNEPPLFLMFDGFPERYAEIDSILAPKKLNIAMKRTGANEWRLTAVIVAGREIPVVGYAILSDARMQEIIDDTRTAWYSVVTDDRLYDPEQRAAALAQALAKLAETGSKAWNSLVGAGGIGQALNSIGRMLEDNPPVAGAPVQIICEERGVDFIFPR
jgi:gamma-glutamyl AIG2-like cyclotransferase